MGDAAGGDVGQATGVVGEAKCDGEGRDSTGDGGNATDVASCAGKGTGWMVDGGTDGLGGPWKLNGRIGCETGVHGA